MQASRVPDLFAYDESGNEKAEFHAWQWIKAITVVIPQNIEYSATTYSWKLSVRTVVLCSDLIL